MSEITLVIQLFENSIRRKLPQLSGFVRKPAPTPSQLGSSVEILSALCPTNPGRCSLSVIYRGDCLEISFWITGTRGPAERQFIINGDLLGAVEATVDYLREIVLGHILVDVVQYRVFWFRPYYLASFRQASRRPSRRTVETLSWANQEFQCS